MIDKTEIERTKLANPITDYLKARDFQLSRKGKQYFCRCPLPTHQDEQASCSVDPNSQLWHCFGCDEGGDIIH